MPEILPSDDDLVPLCRSGDLRAAEALYRRHRPAIHALIWRMVRGAPETEDLVHDVFVRALRGLQGFRGDSSFRTWILHIATNTALNHLERAERAPFAGSLDEPVYRDGDGRVGDLFPNPGAGPEEVAIGRELDDAVQAAIHALPDTYRATLILRDVDGLSYEEIAGILDITLGTVKSRIARARGQVQEWLRGHV